MTRMIGTVGALVSFEEGSELLQELAGVSIDAKQVERTAEALGQEIAADERQHSELSTRFRSPKRFTWESMERAFPCGLRN